MADVIVIGGGLTGLSAAWELERLGVSYTLIEVKPRLGGSIITERREGFVLDGGPFVLEKYGDWPFLAELGLDDALINPSSDKRWVYRDGELVVFKNGTQTLTDALVKRITNPVMTRMAVSSVGQVDGKFAVCLENGLMMETRGLIIAVPARYASHMLYSLQPEAAALLLDYQYDPVARVSLGYTQDAVKGMDLPDTWHFPGSPVKTLFSYVTPFRVPNGCLLVRANVRLDPNQGIAKPADAIAKVRSFLWPVQPVVEWATYWPEADPQTRHLPEFADMMDTIDRLLPLGVALVGSDYRAKRLDQQVEQGQAAARLTTDNLRQT
jgi:protoporphyrinogen oxidase